MFFVKINVALMFLIILLSLKISSTVGGDPSPTTEILKFVPSKSYEGKFSSLSNHQEIEKCYIEVNGVFPEQKKLYDYIQYAIINLTLKSPMADYAKEYYKIFDKYVLSSVETVSQFCNWYPAKHHKDCKEAINLFLLFNLEENEYYNPSYIPTIIHLPLEEVVIDPIILMENALYHLSEDRAKVPIILDISMLEFKNLSSTNGTKSKLRTKFVKEYFKKISSDFVVVKKPSDGRQPFMKPATFCRWFVENGGIEQQGQTSHQEIIDLNPVPDDDLNLELRL